MTKPEFKTGDKVAWKYGAGKATGHIVEKLTAATKLYGKNFKASAEEPKYRIRSEKTGKDAIRNPETLEKLKESEGGEKDPASADEKKEEGDEAEDEEKEDDGYEVGDAAPEKENGTSEREVGGEPLQQMPGSQMKEDIEKDDDKAS